jgi:hypothetical protein
MQKTIPLFLILLLGIVGCDVQRGRFATTGSTMNPLLLPVGSIDSVDGYETKPAHETGILNEQHLLYILIITPDIQEHGSSSSSDYDKYITTLRHTWNTDKGTLTVSIPWNRQTDAVTIGKQEFIRDKGDVFVVRLNANGEISGQQFESLGLHIRYQDGLQYIHQQLPNDELISSVKLYKWKSVYSLSHIAAGVTRRWTGWMRA